MAKLLACERFWHISRNLVLDLSLNVSNAASFSRDIYTGLALAVDELYDNTTALDGTMRRIAGILVEREYRVQEFRGMIDHVIDNHSDLAEDFYRAKGH